MRELQDFSFISLQLPAPFPLLNSPPTAAHSPPIQQGLPAPPPRRAASAPPLLTKSLAISVMMAGKAGTLLRMRFSVPLLVWS